MIFEWPNAKSKTFAGGTFIFAEVNDITVTANEMNED